MNAMCLWKSMTNCGNADRKNVPWLLIFILYYSQKAKIFYIFNINGFNYTVTKISNPFCKIKISIFASSLYKNKNKEIAITSSGEDI